jgi:hypothetical protein
MPRSLREILMTHREATVTEHVGYPVAHGPPEQGLDHWRDSIDRDAHACIDASGAQ